MKFLIVEDDIYKANRVIEVIHHLEGHAYQRVSSHNEAIRKMMTETFDGVVLDMAFPQFADGSGMNEKQGLSVLRQMKRKNLTYPVLVYSSNMFDVSAYDFVVGYVVHDNTCIQSRVKDFIEDIAHVSKTKTI